MKLKLVFSILFITTSLTLNSDPNPLVINKDNKDGTITDLRTKLIWLKCSIGQKNPNNCNGNASDFEWDDAMKECKNLTLGGKKWVTTHPEKSDCTNFQNMLKCINELSEPRRF